MTRVYCHWWCCRPSLLCLADNVLHKLNRPSVRLCNAHDRIITKENR